jgi:hypothetical protein
MSGDCATAGAAAAAAGLAGGTADGGTAVVELECGLDVDTGAGSPGPGVAMRA